jgi:hypothetical protein
LAYQQFYFVRDDHTGYFKVEIKQKTRFIMSESIDYEARMDKIFAEGRLWKHRTLRTVFDPGSSEWDLTTMEQKIVILKKVVKSGEELDELIFDYKERYREQNRGDIAGRIGEATILLLNYNLKEGEML